MIVFHRKISTNPVVETSYWLPIGFQRNVRTYFCLISCVISVGCLFFRRTRPVCLMPEPGASGARAKLIDKSTFGSKSRLKGLPFERARLPASFFLRYLGRIISLPGIRQSGSVRAADQFLPGASITAVQGDAKVTTFTDESGRYTLDLAPGVWDIQVQVFGFTTVHQQVTVGAEPVYKDWTVEMPRIAGAPTPRPGKPDRESWTRRLSSAGEGAGKWPSSRKSTGGTRATGSPATPRFSKRSSYRDPGRPAGIIRSGQRCHRRTRGRLGSRRGIPGQWQHQRRLVAIE